MKWLAILFVVLTLGLASCAKPTDPPAPLSSAKAITSFSFASPAAVGVITESAKTIAVTVPSGTAVTALVATFTASAGAIVKVGATTQVSGTTPNNFTNSVVYTVKAADGTTQPYSVSAVKIAPAFTVTFDSRGGSSVGALGVSAGSTIGVPADPTKSGSIFVGWYKSLSFVDAWNFTADVVAGDLTLYALWVPAPVPAINMFVNGDFCYGMLDWGFWQAPLAASSGIVADGALRIDTTVAPTSQVWEAQFQYWGPKLSFARGKTYSISMKAWSPQSLPINFMTQEKGVDLNGDGDTHTGYAWKYFALTAAPTAYSHQFTMTNQDDPNVDLNFDVGYGSGTIFVQDLVLREVQTPPLEIAGNWNCVWGSAIRMTIDSTNLSFTMGGAYAADVIAYDNSQNLMVVRWTSGDPSWIGKYQKWAWTNDPPAIGQFHVFALTGDYGTAQATATETVVLPQTGGAGIGVTDPANVTVTLSGQSTALSQGSAMTVTASTSSLVDSYAWYVDGALDSSQTTSTYAGGSALATGPHSLMVVVKKNGSLFSAACYFTVQ